MSNQPRKLRGSTRRGGRQSRSHRGSAPDVKARRIEAGQLRRDAGTSAVAAGQIHQERVVVVPAPPAGRAAAG